MQHAGGPAVCRPRAVPLQRFSAVRSGGAVYWYIWHRPPREFRYVAANNKQQAAALRRPPFVAVTNVGCVCAAPA